MFSGSIILIAIAKKMSEENNVSAFVHIKIPMQTFKFVLRKGRQHNRYLPADCKTSVKDNIILY